MTSRAAFVAATLLCLCDGCSVNSAGAGGTRSDVMGATTGEVSSTSDTGGATVNPLDVGVGGSLEGVGSDVDSDGDGTPDIVEGTLDIDGDGKPAHLDPDESTGSVVDASTPEPDGGSDAAVEAEASIPSLAPDAIGAPCTEDQQCSDIVGAGPFGSEDNEATCRLNTGFFSPDVVGGYCSAGCIIPRAGGGPPDGAYGTCGDDAVCSDGDNCLNACATDAECRTDEGYFCDLALGGCTDGEL